jgi:hypothetical protein
MKPSHRSFALAILALSLAACADSPAPFEPLATSPRFLASHGSIAAPSATFSLNGSLTIDWTWQDAEDSWDLVSFSVKRNGSLVTDAIANAKPYTAGATLVRSVVIDAPLSGEYCVEVMAKYSGSTPTLTHHNKSCAYIELNAEAPAGFEVKLRGKNNNLVETLAFVRTAASWNFQFAVKLNDEWVTSCTDLPYGDVVVTFEWLAPSLAAAVALPVVGSECEIIGAMGGKAVYKVQVDNPFKGPPAQSSSGRLAFQIGAASNVNVITFSTN